MYFPRLLPDLDETRYDVENLCISLRSAQDRRHFPNGSQLYYIYKQTASLQNPCVTLRRTLFAMLCIYFLHKKSCTKSRYQDVLSPFDLWQYTTSHSKKGLFTSKFDLNLKKNLVNYYIWSIALYGAETWTLRKEDKKYLENCPGEGWRSVVPIMWDMKYGIPSRRRGISYIQ
jgi:hypothetical protein